MYSKTSAFSSFEVSSLNTLLFSTDYNVYLSDTGDVIKSPLINGSDAHYSIDGTKISFIKSDSSGIFICSLPSGAINHIDVYLPGNSLSNPHLNPNNSKIIFQADSTYYVR